MTTKLEKLPLITPGEILKEEFMEPSALSANQLARALFVPVNRISDILRGRRAITADTALRLEKYFDLEAQFWLNLQSGYELRLAKRSDLRTITAKIKKQATRASALKSQLTSTFLR